MREIGLHERRGKLAVVMYYCTWEVEADGDNLGYAVKLEATLGYMGPYLKRGGGGGELSQ